MQHFRKTFLASTIVCLAATAAVPSLPAFAQVKGAEAPPLTQSGSVSQRLQDIATKNKVSFIFEGDICDLILPRNGFTTPSPLPGKAAADNPDFRQFLDKFCDENDLQWRQYGNLILLRKSYISRTRIPEITLPEYLAMVNNISHLVERYASPMAGPVLSRSTIVQHLVSSFTPDQMEHMQAGNQQAAKVPQIVNIGVQILREGDGIPITEFSPEQRQDLLQVVLNGYTGHALTALKDSLPQAQELVADKGAFCVQTVQDNKLLGFCFESYGPPSMQKVAPIGFIKQWLLADKSHSLTIASTQADHNTDGSQTLNTVVSHSFGKPEARFQVDDVSRDKRETVIGALAGDASDFRALADIYALQVMDRPDGSERLARRDVASPPDIDGLQMAMFQAVPDPFLRDLFANTKFRSESFSITPFALSLKSSDLTETGPTLSSRLEAIRDMAIARLFDSLELKIATKKDGFLPLSELSPEEKETFATALTANLLLSTDNILTSPTPGTIKDFNNLLVNYATQEFRGRSYHHLTFRTQLPPRVQGRTQGKIAFYSVGVLDRSQDTPTAH